MFENKDGGNYRLAANSPCVNRGINQSWMTTWPYDLDGRARIRYGTVDMGAYERINEGTVYGVR
ncbi:MAG: choice-of-anchor Q domain-containing protein [Kiritimatiellia bacterium]|nr:choice-of-anchor Q domain-containing protein [Kiritimatiellia bacterium]